MVSKVCETSNSSLFGDDPTSTIHGRYSVDEIQGGSAGKAKSSKQSSEHSNIASIARD